jgi:hypothetical protein
LVQGVTGRQLDFFADAVLMGSGQSFTSFDAFDQCLFLMVVFCFHADFLLV